MAGIAGITQSHAKRQVEEMLGLIGHRGKHGRKILEVDGVTLGVNGSSSHAGLSSTAETTRIVQDYTSPDHFAMAAITDGKLVLTRDHLGLSPLYYGWVDRGVMGFASEVKALLPLTRRIFHLPPGHRYVDGRCESLFTPAHGEELADPPLFIASELRARLTAAITTCITRDEMGAWLSGGLDSSALAVLTRPCVKTLHTFSTGFSGSSDVHNARLVADFMHSDHHEMILTPDQIRTILPTVIYHLESFDTLLVRSSIANYLVAGMAADYVAEVISGEGADELFAGYLYLKRIALTELAAELHLLAGALHNTALQRVDRCAAAYGIVAHLPFLDAGVVDLAGRIPVEYKIKQGIEKWILRQAVGGLLPKQISARPKAKFWEGSGIGTLLAHHANETIPDRAFEQEKKLANGWVLHSKEELLYYRIFHDHFGDLENLSWMGRTTLH
jgi:asparagine synthase (glutamine-hydrolysing)